MEKTGYLFGLLLLLGLSCAAFASSYNCNSCSDCNAKIADAVAGDTVYLTANATSPSSDCIQMNAKTGVTFDCQGNGMQGGSANYGIFLSWGSGNTIRNCKVSSFTHGIYVYYSDDNDVSKNTASVNGNGDGLKFFSSNNNTVTNNTLSTNNEGILLSNSDWNTVSNNTISSNSMAGIELANSNNNTFILNILTSNGRYGLSFVSSAGNAASLNRVCFHSDQDIHINDSAGNTGSNNICDKTNGWNDAGATGCKTACGATTTTTTTTPTSTSTSTTAGTVTSSTTTTTITCNSCANCNTLIKAASPRGVVTLAANITNQASACINFDRTSGVTLDCQGNGISGTSVYYSSGVVFNYSSGCIVRNCKLSKFYFGVYNYFSNNSVVLGSTVYNNSQDGIYSHYSDGFTVNSSVIYSDGWMAVNLYNSNHSLVSFNLMGNTSYGIQLSRANNCVLTSNIVRNNTYGGVHIDAVASGNTLNYNVVCGNGVKDFNNSLSPGNGGAGNYCDKPDGWNDTGKAGCTYTCSGELTNKTCSSCASCNDLIKASSPGDTISLTADIANYPDNCLSFNDTVGVTFDCKGRAIDGDGLGKSQMFYAVIMQHASLNTVKNCIISGFGQGVYYNYSNNNTLTGSTIKELLNYGVYAGHSNNNTFSGNTVHNCDTGIYLDGSVDNMVTGNSLNNNSADGIFVLGSGHNTITANTLDNNSINGILILNSDGNKVSSNTACYNKVLDYNLSGSSGNTGSGNTCDKPDGWSDLGTGGCTHSCAGGVSRVCDSCGTCNDMIKASSSGDVVYLTANITNHAGTCIEFNGTGGVTFDCQGYSISGLNVTNSFGVAVRYALSDTVENCVISNFMDGILSAYANYSVFRDNYIHNNSADSGIILIYSVNDTIAGNTLRYNGAGLWLDQATGTNVTDNAVEYNRDGLYLDGADYSKVLRNTFTDNTQYGIYLYNTAFKNLIASNTFSGNAVNGIYLKDSSSNTINSNRVCSSGGSDYALLTSTLDSGINNTCDKPGGWNDIGISGCTYTCSGIANKFCSSCSTCSQTLQTSIPGTLVYLTANLSGQSATCINFYKTSGVTLDCQGNGISGTSVYYSSGVVFNYSSGCIVQNCKLSKFYFGVYNYYSNNSVVLGSTVYNNSQDGIYSRYSYGVTVNSSVFYSDGWAGLNLDYSNHSYVSGNSFRNTSYGLALRGANSGSFKGNNVTNNTYGGVWIDIIASGNNLTGNVVCWNGVRDINNSQSSGNSGTENTCDKVLGWNDNGKANCTYACSTVKPCSLTGDYPPCGAITVQEILNLITQWAQGKASIGDVLSLISAWAKG